MGYSYRKQAKQMRDIHVIAQEMNYIETKNLSILVNWALDHPKSHLGKTYIAFIDLHSCLDEITELVEELGVQGQTRKHTLTIFRFMYWIVLRLRDVVGRLILIQIQKRRKLKEKQANEILQDHPLV